jgi:hypothetical protein
MGTFRPDLNQVRSAMADSVWRGSRPFVRWTAMCAQMAFYGTQVWQLVHGRCWMCGPNYVKLSRAFAMQLFGMFIGHYTALPPARSGPSWSHSHAITASIRLAPTEALHYTHNTTTPATLALSRRSSHLPASPDDARRVEGTRMPIAPSGILLLTDIGAAPSPLVPDRTRQHALLATQTSVVATW